MRKEEIERKKKEEERIAQGLDAQDEADKVSNSASNANLLTQDKETNA